MTQKRWYIPLVILLVTVFVPFVRESARVNGLEKQARLRFAPDYSLEQIRSEFDRIRKQELGWLGNGRYGTIPATVSDPAQYWMYVDDKEKLTDAMEKYLDNYRISDPLTSAGVRAQLSSFHENVSTTQVFNSFNTKFGISVVVNAQPKSFYRDRIPKNIEVPGDKKWQLLWTGYLQSIPIMMAVFCLRLHRRELIIWLELWRLIPASVFWPIALFIYPMNVRRKEQLRFALHAVSYGMSAFVSLFGAGAAPLKAQIQKAGKSGSSSQKKSEKNVLDYGIEIYPQTSGLDHGKIVSPWLYHSETLGKGFSLSGFSFVEAGDRKSFLFTNHSADLSHARSKGGMFTTEIGASAEGIFVQVGSRVNLTKVPGIGRNVSKVAKSVVAGHGWRVRGPTHFQEEYLSWASREASLPGGLTIATEGFARFPHGGRASIGQPQIILRHKKMKHLDFMSEMWLIGSKPTLRFGIQLHN